MVTSHITNFCSSKVLFESYDETQSDSAELSLAMANGNIPASVVISSDDAKVRETKPLKRNRLWRPYSRCKEMTCKVTRQRTTPKDIAII